MWRKLTIKQEAFSDYYIELGNAVFCNLNANQVAVKDGYSENYVKGNIVKLLENVSVNSYIEHHMGELKTKHVAD